MKRITIATVVLCLVAALQMMGQTTQTPTSNPTSKPTAKPVPKHTTNPASTSPANAQTPAVSNRTESAPPGQAAGGTQPNANSTTAGSARWQGSERTERNATATSGSAERRQGSAGLKCLGPERHPCTQENMEELSHRMTEKSAEHPALADINTLTLESPDGTVSCRQNNGAPCTMDQIRVLNEHVAAPLRCDIRYEYPRSNTANRTSTSLRQ